jgi:hypothetical protein
MYLKRCRHFFCKSAGVCLSCSTWRMVVTAAHLTHHVFPRLPVRWRVLSATKLLRYFMQRDGAVLNMALRILLSVIAQTLRVHSPVLTIGLPGKRYSRTSV